MVVLFVYLFSSKLVWIATETIGEKNGSKAKESIEWCKIDTFRMEHNIFSSFFFFSGVATELHIFILTWQKKTFPVCTTSKIRLPLFSDLNEPISACIRFTLCFWSSTMFDEVNALACSPWGVCVDAVPKQRHGFYIFHFFFDIFVRLSLLECKQAQSSQWTSPVALEQLSVTTNWRGWLYFHLVLNNAFTLH